MDLILAQLKIVNDLHEFSMNSKFQPFYIRGEVINNYDKQLSLIKATPNDKSVGNTPQLS